MLICDNCGKDNDLGRVFCDQCGTKLDLKGLDSEKMAHLHRVSWLVRHLKKLVLLLVLAVVALALIAAWPQTAPIGDKGTVIGGRRVDAQVGVIRNLGEGRSVTVALAEKDINGYLSYTRGNVLKPDSVSLATEDGYFAVRVVRLLGTFRVGAFTIAPRMSWDLFCVPVEGRVVVRKAWLGHLKLPGPARNQAAKSVAGVFSDQREWAYRTRLSRIEVKRGTVSLFVGR